MKALPLMTSFVVHVLMQANKIQVLIKLEGSGRLFQKPTEDPWF